MATLQQPSVPTMNTPTSGGMEKKAAKRGGWKKSSDKPKRPLSSYNLFFQFKRAEILKQTPARNDGKPRRSHGKIGFASLARTVAAEWNTIDPESRKHFDKLAADDKARYKREMDVWKANQVAEKSRDLSLKSGVMGEVSYGGMSFNPIAKSAAAPSTPSNNNGVPFKFISMANSGQGQRSTSNVGLPYLSADLFSSGSMTSRVNENKSGSSLGHTSAVVGQALALLDDDLDLSDDIFEPFTPSRNTASPLEQPSSVFEGRRHNVTPDVSDLAAKLDDECLGIMAGLLF